VSDNSHTPGRIVLGITGGIAAYKTAELVRLLTRHGHDVVPIMTPWATRFIGPLTLEALTGHPVRVETAGNQTESGIEHISLLRGAELFLIAPLTANTLAKMVMGLADNFLTSAYLAHRAPTLVCPAMNTAMLEHPATRRNLARLKEDGVHIVFGEAGDLACGEVGAGRMAEPEVIAEAVRTVMTPRLPGVAGKRYLVSAGPTREELDPVRFLTNHSSGKMGLAVARALRDAGAIVTLIHGPIHERLPHGIECIGVVSAAEMAEAILPRQAEMDGIVMAAAVADYRPERRTHKLKKGDFDGTVILERTTDILAALGASKREGQILAGFAAETERLLDNARGKLTRKSLDVIFANDISRADSGFASDRNEITAITSDGTPIALGSGDKDALAREIAVILAGLGGP